MQQQTLTGFDKYGKTTRRAQFLAERDRVVPWTELCAMIEPHYPKVSPEGGRPALPLERMLRVYFLQQWSFGMKAHVAVDSRNKLFHTVLVSAANVADRDALPYLLHGRETRVWGDQGYLGQTEVIRRRAPAAQDCTNRRYRQGGWIDETIKATNREKSRVRAKVEHSIGVIKRIFGFQKVRYRGLARNLHRLAVSAALANLFMVRRQLPRLQG